MTTEYHSDRGIESAEKHYQTWQQVNRLGSLSAIGIVILLIIMFFALL